MKRLFISEKPSVAQEFAKALKVNGKKYDGYLESEDTIVTWCVGHLVTMSYPEVYDKALAKWNFQTIPFLPKEFRYEVISSVKKQFQTVKTLLNREDVDTIYVCTDSGREGEYIYRLVDQMAQVPHTKKKKRVWIDSQTEEEILKGIQNAKPISAYDNLSDAAYLRAKEDYLMGINFTRALTLKYGNIVNNYLKEEKWKSINVGRVMTCVQGMVVRREREIREFVKTPFFRVISNICVSEKTFEGEWRAVEGSQYFQSPILYKENGFKKREDAEKLITILLNQASNKKENQLITTIEKVEKKKENKQPPLLYNLAELQNDCSKMFKISPDETLKIVQELYEKKLVTYPRTDARVLSTAVSKEIYKNISGLRNYIHGKVFADEILEKKSYQNIAKTKYVNDKQITDHYAIIPTGQGLGTLNGLAPTKVNVYEIIVRRFLSIFYPPAVYQKTNVVSYMNAAFKNAESKNEETTIERFFSTFKVMLEEGYLKVLQYSFRKKKDIIEQEADKKKEENKDTKNIEKEQQEDTKELEDKIDADLIKEVQKLKKGMILPVKEVVIKEGETTPPKRYNSGSLILTMENAGQFVEDEELRAQIKGSGIGTSATRAEILNKLISIGYLNLNKKTQTITPTLLGEIIYDIVNYSIRSLLNPELTASWEKGLTYVAEGTTTEKEYMEKLEGFVSRLTNGIKNLENQNQLIGIFEQSAQHYKTNKSSKTTSKAAPKTIQKSSNK